MKKTQHILSFLTLLFVTTIFFSCEKDEVESQNIPTENVQQAEDGTEQREATDETIDVALDVLNGTSLRTTEDGTDNCNFLTTVNQENKSVTITFNGDNCIKNRKREGSITAKVISEVKTYQQGGKVEITYNNLKVTRKSDNKSLTINGRIVVTNINGISNPIVHTIHGTLKINFDNGTARTWKVARKRTITIVDQVITFKVEGDSLGNFISEAGVTRDGKDFITTITSPLLVQNCTVNDFKIINGKIIYAVGGVSLSADFGYTSLTQKAGNCSATGAVYSYADSTTVAQKYYPY